MNGVVMIKPEAIDGPNGADSLLPRQIYWYLWMPNLSVRETNTEHPVWHCSLRRPAGYWGQVDYIEPFLSWKDHPFNLIWIINTFWVWAFSSSPTQLSAGLHIPDPQTWPHTLHRSGTDVKWRKHRRRRWCWNGPRLWQSWVISYPMPLRGFWTHRTLWWTPKSAAETPIQSKHPERNGCHSS